MIYRVTVLDHRGVVLRVDAGIVPWPQGGMQIPLEPIPHGGTIKVDFELLKSDD